MKPVRRRDETGSLPVTLALAATLVLTSLIVFQVAQVASGWLTLRQAALDHAYRVAGHLLTGNQGCLESIDPRFHRCQVAGNQIQVVYIESVHTFIGPQEIRARAAVGFRFPEP